LGGATEGELISQIIPADRKSSTDNVTTLLLFLVTGCLLPVGESSFPERARLLRSYRIGLLGGTGLATRLNIKLDFAVLHLVKGFNP